MAVIDDKNKKIQCTKEDLQIKFDPTQLTLLVRKKGSKKDYEWCIGLINTFEVYSVN
jgi:hypothetical protein